MQEETHPWGWRLNIGMRRRVPIRALTDELFRLMLTGVVRLPEAADVADAFVCAELPKECLCTLGA
jgi:hypothetical protein